MSIRDIKKQAATTSYLLPAWEAWRIKDNREESKKRIDGKLHPSSLSMCPTAAVLETMNLVPGGKNFDSRLLRIFDTGTALHRMVQSQLYKAGLIPSWPDGTPMVEVPIPENDRLMAGNADGVVLLTKPKKIAAILEIKSINSRSFDALSAADPKHTVQATHYCVEIEDTIKGLFPDYEVGYILFVYFSKDTAAIKEFLVEVTPKLRADAEVKREAGAKMIQALKERGELPKPYYSEFNKPPCRTCQMSGICHSALSRDQWAASKEIKDAIAAIRSTPSEAGTEERQPSATKRLPPRRVVR